MSNDGLTPESSKIEVLLQGMRAAFLDELPERCNSIEQLVLELNKSPDEQGLFEDLYRRVHSLKGAGGTFRLPMITSICHHFESHIDECGGKYGKGFVVNALAFVDLLRQVGDQAQDVNPEYSELEAMLEQLHVARLKSRRTGLVAESSGMMANLYQNILGDLPLRLTFVDSGLAALERSIYERFDFLIVAKELNQLNGLAVAAALRASNGRNHETPIILVTSAREDIPVHSGVSSVVRRDQKFAESLAEVVSRVLG